MLEAHFDPQLSAEIHNRILEHAWIGAGREVASLPSTSWWEESSLISFDLASRLNPNLVRFLRSAKSAISVPNSNFHFFYYLRGLQEKEDLLGFSVLESRGDRYVWLYPSTCSKSDDEVGILLVDSIYGIILGYTSILTKVIGSIKRLNSLPFSQIGWMLLLILKRNGPGGLYSIFSRPI